MNKKSNNDHEDLYPSVLRTAEETIVGQALLDTAVYDEAGLKPEHFFNPKLSEAWRGIGACLESGVVPDPITVADHSTKLNPADLSAYTLDITSTENSYYYSGVIRDAYVSRSIAKLGSDCNRWRSLGHSGPEILGKLRASIEAIESHTGRSLPVLGEVVGLEQSRIQEDKALLGVGKPVIRGLPSGLGIERVCPGGIPVDKVTTIFGESGNFKTTVKNNLIWNIASSGIGSVLDISLEDSDELNAQRYLAKQTGIGYGKIATRTLDDHETKKLLDVEPDMASRNIICGESIPPDIDEIIRTARHYKRTCGLVAVVVDYIQLLSGEREDLNEIVRKAQLSARRDRIAYVFVSQVKQEVDLRDDHRPRITDMLGSSSLRTGSKLSIGVYRPSLYEPEPSKRSDYYNMYCNHPEGRDIYSNLIELWLQKNVLGEDRVCLTCLVNKQTGVLQYFDIKRYL